MDPSHPKIAVLITSHNRRDLTLAAICAIPAAINRVADFDVVLVDADSSDGTAIAARSLSPQPIVYNAGRDTYWNAGMLEAWRQALRLSPDYYLWLNDDLTLVPDAIANLLQAYESAASSCGGKTIIVGKVVDPVSGQVTYGGYRRKRGLSRINWRHLEAGERDCDTMNGNCVLIPARAVADIGLLSSRYQHAFGDIDYGLRARRAGYGIVECPTPVGVQVRNEQIYSAGRLPISWKTLRFVLTSPKGVPIGEWLHFCRRYAGPLWPINFLYRYIRLFT